MIQLCKFLQLETLMGLYFNYYLSTYYFRIDGGVSNNDFIVQLIATLTGKRLNRFEDTETSAFGVAFVAGLQSNVWKSKQDILTLRKKFQTFHPDQTIREKCLTKYKRWTEACHRFKNWNQN